MFSALQKTRIVHRVMIGFFATLVLTTVLGFISINRVDLINQGLTTINDLNSVKQRFAINFRGSVHDRAISLRDVTLVDSAADVQANVADIERLAEAYRQSAVSLDRMLSDPAQVSPEEARILASIKATEAKTLPVSERVIALRKAGDQAQAKQVMMTEARPLFTEWLARINQFIDLQEANNQKLGQSVRGVSANFTAMTLLLLGSALLIGLAFAWWSIRAIRPLTGLTQVMTQFANGDLQASVPHSDRADEVGAMAKALQIFRSNALAMRTMESEAAAARQAAEAERLSTDEQRARTVKEQLDGARQQEQIVDLLASGLQRLAQGDLTCRIEAPVPADYLKLRDDFNVMVDRLSDMVGMIQATSADVGMAAREITMGAADLSTRTEGQASSLEETAATTEQLAASVKASAQASRQAAAVADEAKQAAQAGGAIAGQAVEAMARIEDASQKISDIIRVIDDIAFQTNLLALNAAVEAARAGDAGKGFAVVASEVRTLAQRSGEAAKDISALISSSNMEVGEGVKLVRQAGESLDRILAASQKVAATIADISAASGEQANGIDEMSQAVAHLDEMTQANAALAEQSAASAGSLSSKIGELNDLVAAFKTGPAASHGDSHAAPRGAASEPARLRQLAQAAFANKSPALRAAAPAHRAAPTAPARKVANSRAGDRGWEEF
ncbi:methyl-accepting chemotaxis protein [Bosea sp. (in: a-proteobacteria)]|uniref:HAMP domain-containing methyl-accepting chemotaxis protein n=1 Tax=Bosea sp. (in: a-proteobacteria) TaxID=1871050 RepID=UPI0027369901|nr:methyl-accepting chemotaxis protein [Bosea sp. (in: a-proteobacteria)]MDP3411330.1 methyl-accepting chemotaxis protein [Bosea sp. (in: a-proteobacteria)]